MKFKKKKTKTRWHQKRFKDIYFKEAKLKGYRSRSVFKLIDINKKFRILKKGQSVLDIGSSPGGWSQILSQYVYSKNLSNKIIAVDIKEMKTIENIIFFKKNIFDDNFIAILKKYFLQGIDLVISDAALPTTGIKTKDHIASLELCNRTFNIALNILNKGGGLILKIFQGKETNLFINQVSKRFSKVNLYKPTSSKSESKEIFIIARFFN